MEIEAVRKTSEKEYHLLCAVCGNVAGIIRFPVKWYGGKNVIEYQGLTHTRGISLWWRWKVVGYLKRNNIRGLHTFLSRRKMPVEGLDAFCPDCGKIYCREHYQITMEMDEGFYDCSYGLCPEGHRRMIDD